MGPSYKFLSVGQAIAYYNYKNPARARFQNLLELEGGSNHYHQPFSGDHPDDIYAEVLHSLKSVLTNSRELTKKIFKTYYKISERKSDIMGREEVAKHLGISVRYFDKLKRQFLDELEIELIRRGLMKPKEKTEL